MKSKINAAGMAMVIFTFFLMSVAKAQTPLSCEVQLAQLKGTYVGDCKGGKAHGAGKATGVDSYEGMFVNGLPDGTGIYHYANGNFYSGNFRKGKMDGKGEFHYLRDNLSDSVISGDWANNLYKFSGKSFEIISKTSAITRFTIKEIKGTDLGIVTIESKALNKNPNINLPTTRTDSRMADAEGNPVGQGSGGALTAQQASANKMDGPYRRDPAYDLNQSKNYVRLYQVSSYNVFAGNFVNVFKRNTDKTATTEFQGVTFPFRATVNFDTDIIEFVINKPGTWKVEATISTEN